MKESASAPPENSLDAADPNRARCANFLRNRCSKDACFGGDTFANLGQAPNACVHAAYYGTYHAGTAILYIAGGVGKAKHVPQAHAGVLEHFSKLANAKEHEAMIAAELLNRARSARMTADYGGAEPPDEAEMRECVTDAREFIRLCCRYFDLPPFQLDA